jgi:hypothetical protein
MMAGTTNLAIHAQHLERFFEVLGPHGFGLEEAYETYVQLMSAVTGAAVLEVGGRASAEAGSSLLSDIGRASRALADDAVPLVRKLVGDGHAEHPDRFETVRVMLEGIAARRRRAAG